MNRSTAINQTAIKRRTVIGGALVALLAFPEGAHAQEKPEKAEKAKVKDSFVLLLKGLYHPVVQGPNLGLSTVDLGDGSYSTTKIYPVSGIAGSENVNQAIGDFSVQFAGDLCAYDVPGGSFSMRFTGQNTVFVDDGSGGRFLQGTFDLTILEATGIFRHVVGGHNHMLDNLHFLGSADGSGGVDEYCVCFITRHDD